MPTATGLEKIPILSFSRNASSRAEPSSVDLRLQPGASEARRSEGSREECHGSARRIPRPAGESAGLRDDASETGKAQSEARRPLLLGHRGTRAVKSIRENTLVAFDRALGDGCDGFEFDVRLTRDGEAVVCHDPRSGRVEIARATAKQLPGLPRLEEILTCYGVRAFLDVELKVSGLEKITVDLLHKHPPQRGFVVSSFLPEVLESVHRLNEKIPLGLICDTRAQLRRWTEISCQYVIPHYRLLTAALLGRVHDAGKKVLVWTVNLPRDMQRFANRGVDGIISDKTNLLCRSVFG